MTDLTFEDATPVKRVGTGGKTAAPNPYVDVIAAIALKTDDQGNAIAKRFTLHAGHQDVLGTLINRAKRQLSAAGKNNTPAVTVRTDVSDVETTEVQLKPGQPKTLDHSVKVTFWTVKKYNAPAETAPEGDTASE
jgi:hypothetical protein